MSRITNAEMYAAFEAVQTAHRKAGIVRRYWEAAPYTKWNAEHPRGAAEITALAGRIRTDDEQRALETLVHARQGWCGEHAEVTIMGWADMVFSQGSATYGNAWGIHYSPWHNPLSEHFHVDMSGHYEVNGVSHLGTDRSLALARMRAHVSGIYAVLNSDKADA